MEESENDELRDEGDGICNDTQCVVYLDEEEEGGDDDDADDICWGHKGVVYLGLGTAGAVT